MASWGEQRSHRSFPLALLLLITLVGATAIVALVLLKDIHALTVVRMAMAEQKGPDMWIYYKQMP